jgi:hypothetical protein
MPRTGTEPGSRAAWLTQVNAANSPVFPTNSVGAAGNCLGMALGTGKASGAVDPMVSGSGAQSIALALIFPL